MRLPTTALAQKEDIPTTGDVVSCGQFPDEPPVKLRGLFEGECFQCFDQGEPGFLQPSLFPVLRTDLEFHFREVQKKFFVARAPFLGLAEAFFKVSGCVAEGEAPQVFMKLQEESRVHCPVSRAE